MTIERFRGNIVLSGGEAWEEDHYKQVKIKSQKPGVPDVKVDVVGRCIRCPVPTISPETAVKHKVGEPIRSMAKFRRIDPGAKYKVAFGA